MRMLNAMRMCSKRGVSAVAAALAFRLAKLSAILSSSRFVTRTARLPGMMEMIPRSGLAADACWKQSLYNFRLLLQS